MDRVGEYNCYEPGLENPTILKKLSRFEKGFLFERLVWSMLERSRISNIHNSRIFHNWKKSTGDGYDILVKAGDSFLNVECKFILTKPYSSWIRRDWISRNCDIFICNAKWLVSPRDRDLIKSYGFKLMSPFEFLWYVFKISSSLNKYSLNKLLSNRAKLLNEDSGHKTEVSLKNFSLNLYSSVNPDSKMHRFKFEELQSSWFCPTLHQRVSLPLNRNWFMHLSVSTQTIGRFTCTFRPEYLTESCSTSSLLDYWWESSPVRQRPRTLERQIDVP